MKIELIRWPTDQELDDKWGDAINDYCSGLYDDHGVGYAVDDALSEIVFYVAKINDGDEETLCCNDVYGEARTNKLVMKITDDLYYDKHQGWQPFSDYERLVALDYSDEEE
jgi:hypothetical protein